jgi:hypothetical protein
MIYVFNRNWVDTRWQQHSTHLHTNSTQNTENEIYITMKKLNIHNNKKLTYPKEKLSKNWSLFSSKFEVSEFINPGADFEKIVCKTIMDLFRLTKNDMLVCSGCGNDVYKNPKELILQIMTFFSTMITQT